MVRIGLRRTGKKKRPYYRVVVAPGTAPREGRFVEIIGHYDPIPDPLVIDFNEERALHWLRCGAQPTETVQRLMKKSGIWAKFKGGAEA